VYARGNDRRVVFADDVDRRAYLAMLARVVERSGWLVLAFCLMDNHVHLVVETPRANLGRGMQLLHGAYAAFFNRRHLRSGHLWQGRYGAKRVRSDAQLLATVRYVAANPVDAGLRDRPGEWPWDSTAAVLSGRAPAWLARGRLLAYLGAIGGGSVIKRFRERLGLGEGTPPGAGAGPSGSGEERSGRGREEGAIPGQRPADADAGRSGERPPTRPPPSPP